MLALLARQYQMKIRCFMRAPSGRAKAHDMYHTLSWPNRSPDGNTAVPLLTNSSLEG